jgi:hypothetical protein
VPTVAARSTARKQLDADAKALAAALPVSLDIRQMLATGIIKLALSLSAVA